MDEVYDSTSEPRRYQYILAVKAYLVIGREACWTEAGRDFHNLAVRIINIPNDFKTLSGFDETVSNIISVLKNHVCLSLPYLI